MDAPKIETLPSPGLASRSPPHRTSPPPPPPAPAALVPRKRPAPDDEDDQLEDTNSVTAQDADRARARVTCEVCDQVISFRDTSTGGFTLAHWDSHRLKCSPSSPSGGSTRASAHPPVSTHPSVASASRPILPTSVSTPPVISSGLADPDGRPAPKRRRAKRTEEQRIEYFRSDPFVAEVEAYRVLCGSCNKWIRLRPNSTYCSIPWDSHRKSCLAKNGKLNGQTHVTHAVSASSASTTTPIASSVPPPAPHQLALASASAPARAPAESPADARADSSSSDKPLSSSLASAARSPSATHTSINSDDLSPEARVLESRRKSADQRRAALVADPMLTAVEPSRVFCSLCQKWVQLRQDSTYCAYPWVQHRSKCVSRHQRRTERAAEIASARAARDAERGIRSHHRVPTSSSAADAQSVSGSGSDHADVESEDEDADAEGDVIVGVELTSAEGRAQFVRRARSWLLTTTYANEDIDVEPLVRFLNASLPPGKFEGFERPEVELVLGLPPAAPLEAVA